MRLILIASLAVILAVVAGCGEESIIPTPPVVTGEDVARVRARLFRIKFTEPQLAEACRYYANNEWYFGDASDAAYEAAIDSGDVSPGSNRVVRAIEWMHRYTQDITITPEWETALFESLGALDEWSDADHDAFEAAYVESERQVLEPLCMSYGATPAPTRTAPAPRATPTPLPAPTTEGCPTALEEGYFQSLNEHGRTIGNGISSISELMLESSEDPSLMFDEAWIISVALQVTTLDKAADDILAMDSPSSASEIRDYARSMAQHLKDANDLLIVGIDNVDVEALEGVGTAWGNVVEQAEQMLIAQGKFCN